MFSTDELKSLEGNAIYDQIRDTSWTNLTRSALLSYLDGISKLNPKDALLLQYIVYLIRAKAELQSMNQADLDYLITAGATPDSKLYTFNHSGTRHILAAGGTLATVEFIAAVSGKKIAIRDIRVGFAPGAGVGADASCLVYIEDEDGNDLGYCNCAVGSSMSVIKHLAVPAVSKAIHILVGAGPTHCAAGKLSVDANYWVV